MSLRPKLSSVVEKQLPEFVREDHQQFVTFLKAYYEYLDNQSLDLKNLRDLDNTLDEFIKHFKNELAVNFPTTVVNERFLLQHIKEQYLAKGSENSFKLLFKLLFNKDVTIEYPSTQMLRASDGKWNQDISIICKVLTGHPDQIVGKIVDVITATKVIRVLVDRRQFVEVEVERVVQIAEGVYEFYIDRRFFGDISIGDRIRYQTDDIYFTAEILATTSKLQVLDPGTGFKVGQLYSIRNGQGSGSIMKVTRTSATGGILSAEFIKYGVGYTTEFTSTIYPDLGQSAAGTGGTALSVVGSNISISEVTDGFSEAGIINRNDYTSDGWDGTYSGEILREFGEQGVTVQSEFIPAVIKVTLGPLGKYPGYYVNNDGFLNDAIYIQDSRFYQAFSYVLKIDEQLDKYKSIVKALVHPAGMAVFGEYDIRNEFDIGVELESLIKLLAVVVKDELFSIDSKALLSVSKVLDDLLSAPTDAISTKGITKPLADSTSYADALSTIGTGKTLNATHTNFDGTLDNESVVLTDAVSNKTFGKALADFPSMGDVLTARDFGKRLDDTPIVTDQPAISMTKYIDPAISGTDTASVDDQGGFMILNPYGDAGWFLEQYVGTPINF